MGMEPYLKTKSELEKRKQAEGKNMDTQGRVIERTK